MRQLALNVPVVMLAGCTIAGLDPPAAQGETGQLSKVTDPVRYDVNGLAPAGIASTALTTAMLDATSAAAMATSPAARNVLAYAVGCALDSTQTISFMVDGVAFTDAGGAGIAPGWTTRPLSTAEAAWVSACVFAHANELSTVIWISLRGDQAGLSTTVAERAQYQVEEGAFWGNVFVDLGPIAGYSCEGIDQAVDDSYADLSERECAQWDGIPGSSTSPCGLGYAGLCGSVCSTGTAPYAGCSFQGGPASPSVVTTFLVGAPK
jgi:hypothetical protein